MADEKIKKVEPVHFSTFEYKPDDGREFVTTNMRPHTGANIVADVPVPVARDLADALQMYGVDEKGFFEKVARMMSVNIPTPLGFYLPGDTGEDGQKITGSYVKDKTTGAVTYVADKDGNGPHPDLYTLKDGGKGLVEAAYTLSMAKTEKAASSGVKAKAAKADAMEGAIKAAGFGSLEEMLAWAKKNNPQD